MTEHAIHLSLSAADPDEMRRILIGLLSMGGPVAANVVSNSAAIPLTAAAEANHARVTTEGTGNAVPTEQTTPGSRLSLDALKAGITLKPTQSSTLGDGGTVASGDHVLHNGQEWLVEATYRGTIIASNEEGTYDVLKTADCKAVPAQQQTPTTATTTTQPDATNAASGAPSGKIAPETAHKLREMATGIVTGGKVSAEQVFSKLAELGANNIDGLTPDAAAVLEAWLTGAGNQSAMKF